MNLRQARDVAEGFAYRMIFYGACEKRRRILGRKGLRPLRETWWTPLKYETNSALWRNLCLLESSPEPRQAEATFTETARVAVYTPGHIGDALQTVPLLRALRAARPGMELTWVVGPWCERLASRYSEVDQVDVFSPAWFQYRRGAGGPSLKGQKQWGSAKSAVDVFLSTARTDLTALFVGRSVRTAWWIGRPPSCNLYPVASREDVMTVDENLNEAEDLLKLASSLGIRGGDSQLSYRVTEDERHAAEALLVKLGVSSETPYAVISPCAGWVGKQWALERWAAVADELQERGLAILLVGTEGEREQCLLVKATMKRPVVILAGQTRLEELAAITAGARLWLGSDSGGLHLAAAVGTPTVSLFGPTNPAKWAPRGSRHRFLRAVESCPGCVPWHPRAYCLHKAACMKQIEVRTVVEAAENLLRIIP